MMNSSTEIKLTQSYEVTMSATDMTETELNIFLELQKYLKLDRSAFDSVIKIPISTVMDFTQVRSEEEDKKVINYTQVKLAAKKIAGRVLTLTDMVDGITTHMPIFQKITHDIVLSEKGYLSVAFNSEIKKYLVSVPDRKHDNKTLPYTTFDYYSAKGIVGKYAKKLYPIFKHWEGKGFVYFSKDKLIQLLSLSDRYNKLTWLKQEILIPALEEISNYSDIGISYNQRKTINKVVGFEFSIGPNLNQQLNLFHNPASTVNEETEVDLKVKAIDQFEKLRLSDVQIDKIMKHVTVKEIFKTNYEIQTSKKAKSNLGAYTASVYRKKYAIPLF